MVQSSKDNEKAAQNAGTEWKKEELSANPKIESVQNAKDTDTIQKIVLRKTRKEKIFCSQGMIEIVGQKIQPKRRNDN